MQPKHWKIKLKKSLQNKEIQRDRIEKGKTCRASLGGPILG